MATLSHAEVSVTSPCSAKNATGMCRSGYAEPFDTRRISPKYWPVGAVDEMVSDVGDLALDAALFGRSFDRGGGLLSPDLVTLLEPLVFVLQDTDLHADTERFEAMLPRG